MLATKQDTKKATNGDTSQDTTTTASRKVTTSDMTKDIILVLMTAAK